MQILFTKFKSNWHKDIQNVFWIIETVLRMEKNCHGPLYVLQSVRKNHHWCLIGIEGKI